jgi:hypothetical protein
MDLVGANRLQLPGMGTQLTPWGTTPWGLVNKTGSQPPKFDGGEPVTDFPYIGRGNGKCQFYGRAPPGAIDLFPRQRAPILSYNAPAQLLQPTQPGNEPKCNLVQ